MRPPFFHKARGGIDYSFIPDLRQETALVTMKRSHKSLNSSATIASQSDAELSYGTPGGGSYEDCELNLPVVFVPEKCRLCSSLLVNKHKMKITPCMHTFCFTCVMTWEAERRKKQESTTGCPFCISLFPSEPLPSPIKPQHNTPIKSKQKKRIKQEIPSVYSPCPFAPCHGMVVDLKPHLDRFHSLKPCEYCGIVVDGMAMAKHWADTCLERRGPCINHPFGCEQEIRVNVPNMTDEEAYNDHRCIAVIPCILCQPLSYVGQGREGWMVHNQMHSIAHNIRPEPSAILVETTGEECMSSFDFYYY